MKAYGANKATEFSKKQIGVIYRMAKNGELKVEKFVMSELYNLADFYGYDDNHNVERAEAKVLGILESVFAGNVEDAQKRINDFTEWHYNLLSAKYQRNADRALVG